MEKKESERVSGQHHSASSKTRRGLQDSLSNFTHNTKPGGVLDILESRHAFQRALSKLEVTAIKFMKIKYSKSQVVALALGLNANLQKRTQGLVKQKLNIS